MLERIGVLEDDVRMLRGIVAELALFMKFEGAWKLGGQHYTYIACKVCRAGIGRDDIVAYLEGKPFPHTDDCPYAAGLRIANEEASHEQG